MHARWTLDHILHRDATREPGAEDRLPDFDGAYEEALAIGFVPLGIQFSRVLGEAMAIELVDEDDTPISRAAFVRRIEGAGEEERVHLERMLALHDQMDTVRDITDDGSWARVLRHPEHAAVMCLERTADGVYTSFNSFLEDGRRLSAVGLPAGHPTIAQAEPPAVAMFSRARVPGLYRLFSWLHDWGPHKYYPDRSGVGLGRTVAQRTTVAEDFSAYLAWRDARLRRAPGVLVAPDMALALAFDRRADHVLDDHLARNQVFAGRIELGWRVLSWLALAAVALAAGGPWWMALVAVVLGGWAGGAWWVWATGSAGPLSPLLATAVWLGVGWAAGLAAWGSLGVLALAVGMTAVGRVLWYGVAERHHLRAPRDTEPPIVPYPEVLDAYRE